MLKRVLATAIGLLVSCLLVGCDRRVDVDLNYAIEHGDFDWARELLDDGANIDARYLLSRGNTNLMILVREDKYEEGVQFVLDNGADLDTQNFDGRTALFIAAQAGKARYVSTLLEAGADVNVRNKNGDTALKAAYDAGHKVIERTLREAGATY